jgi:hypothetical protein
MSAHVVELVVRGRLSPELVMALDGFDVETNDDGLTRIVGSVADQARLFGILDMLDDLHIEVVSVNPVTPGGAGA